ncbi:MAG: hypothetical protein KDE51_01405 [Anaerolineales bacterium]|nr:hypothetical protein [Anaerolineales bacterium]
MSVKEQILALIEKLPDDVTWDDVMHEIYVRQTIEAGLEDSKAGRVKNVDEVRKQFDL